MFKYPFSLKEVVQRDTHGNRAIITCDFAPALGSMVPLDLHPYAEHGIWYVYSIRANEVHLHTDRLAILDPFGLEKHIRAGGHHNTDFDQHDIEVNAYLHEIVNELCRAEKKFPHWNADAVYAAAILGEESGETMQAALDFHQAPLFDEDLRIKIEQEAIQSGAMAVRLLINAHRFEHASNLFDPADMKRLRTMLIAKTEPAEIMEYLNGLIK